MTREEAISRLKEGEPFSEIYDSSWNEALDMAISALTTDGEYIKKEDALKALHDFWDECINYDGSGTEMMLDNESVINSLPTYFSLDSAENKGEDRPKGHWIESGYVGNDNYLFECSECHHTDTQSKAVKVNYCWHCGADMRGET